MMQEGIPQVGSSPVGTALFSFEDSLKRVLLAKPWNYPEVANARDLRLLGEKLLGENGCKMFMLESRTILLDLEVRGCSLDGSGYKDGLAQIVLERLLKKADQNALQYIRLVNEGASAGWSTEFSSFQNWADDVRRSAVLVGELYQLYHEQSPRTTTALYLLLACVYTRRPDLARNPLRAAIPSRTNVLSAAPIFPRA